VPYDFKDSDGKHKGISKDFLNSIFRNIEGTRLEYVDENNWKESVEKVARKEMDILLSASPIRENASMLLSIPYIEVPYMLFGTANSDYVESIEELNGKTIGFVEQSHDIKKLRQRYPRIEFVSYNTGKELIEAINLGIVNYFLASLPAVNYATKTQGITNIKLIGKTDEMFRLSFAVRNDWPEMVGILNKYLRSMHENEKSKIYDNWFKLEIKPETDYSLLWKVLAVFMFALMAFFYWNRKLSLEISRRTETEAKLIIAQQKAENANRAKSEFLSNMSHEIRTPMNAIIGFAELSSKMDNIPKPLEHNIKTILRSAKALIAIINDILDLSKIEAGKLKIQKEPSDIQDLADELYDVFYVKTEEKGLIYTVEFDDSVPHALFVDEIRMRQILLNLVGNAIKFTDKGFVRVCFKATPNSAHDSTIDLHVSVQDSGIGINPEDREKVFEVFEQQSGQNNRKFGGTGLGLSISQQLAKLMNGVITLDAPQEGGSIFTLVLEHVEIASAHPKTEKFLSKKGLLFPKVKVLAVDDIEDNLVLIQTLLTHYGFHVLTCNDGLQSIELAQKHLPKLIFMDIKMPNMDGYEVTRILKGSPQTEAIPVIAVSASVLGEKEEAMRKGSFDAFVSKPINTSELENAIMKFILPLNDARELEVEDEAIPVALHYALIMPQEQKAFWIETLKEALHKGDLSALEKSVKDLFHAKALDAKTSEELEMAIATFDLQSIERLVLAIINATKKEL